MAFDFSLSASHWPLFSYIFGLGQSAGEVPERVPRALTMIGRSSKVDLPGPNVLAYVVGGKAHHFDLPGTFCFWQGFERIKHKYANCGRQINGLAALLYLLHQRRHSYLPVGGNLEQSIPKFVFQETLVFFSLITMERLMTAVFML